MKTSQALLKETPIADIESPAPLQAPRPTLVATPASGSRIQLWDLPLRVFHWSLVAAVTTAVATGLEGGAWMDLHGKAGLAILGLLAFRLVWGVLGPQPARFAHFWPSPPKVLDYLRGRWQGLGHNPLGALSVFALLSLLAAQSITGLFSNDDISFFGPLAQWVGDDRSAALTGWHHWLAKGLYGLLGLHVAAIGFYVLVEKTNLVRPMITGWKEVEPGTLSPRPASHFALIFAVVVGIAAVYIASGAWARH